MRPADETAARIVQLLSQGDGGPRVCPAPGAWHALWRLLTDTRTRDAPPRDLLPLILSAWYNTTDAQKTERLLGQIRWAEDHGMLENVVAYLEALSEASWHHGRD